MAALTQSAIEGLLGRLATVIKDEAQLISGVPGDMKFIKDEMDSMNSFLLHLNKMESEHDDQIRAWMKQVHEVAYIAEDCVQRYVRDMARHRVDRGGCAGYVAIARLFLRDHKACCQLRKLGKQITELKARVYEVSERRLRYDVKVPAGGRLVQTVKVPAGRKLVEEERRKEFMRTLEEELVEEDRRARDQAQAPALLGSSLLLRARTKMGGLLQDALAVPSAVLGRSNGAIAKLPAVVVSSEAATVRGILKKCCPPAGADAAGAQDGGGALSEAWAFRCTKKMFLCALYVYPYQTNAELQKLKMEVVEAVDAQEARKKVMVFCYSMLTTQQKSCLQYLSAFFYEREISRTSMVRRWIAEGLVGKEPGGGGRDTATPEEAGERCFRELLFRGFILAKRSSPAGIVKSCVVDDPVKDFVEYITKSESFLFDLPSHFQQLEIRRIVLLHPFRPPPQPRNMLVNRCCGGDCSWFDDEDYHEYASSAGDGITNAKHPIDELVDYIKGLPNKLYRLKVLDLGGCRGLRRRHLERLFESLKYLQSLRYLSLRNTDVAGLRARHINKLTELETLDIQGTNIPPRDTKRIYLQHLKHLLAGHFPTTTTTATATATARTPSAEKATLVTVHMPERIGSMRLIQTLSHLQVSTDGAELQGVAKLQHLRKLGVVVHANTATAAGLGRVLFVLADCLRSLSVWVVDAVAVAHTRTTTAAQQAGKGGGEGILDISAMHEMASSMVLENLEITGKMSLPSCSWIERAPKLANVTLRDTEMDGGDALRRLAAVLSLRCLRLSRKAFTEQALRFKDDVQFQALKFLVIEGDAATRIAFHSKDAAPKLEKIVWAIGGGSTIAQTQNEELIVGIQHLPKLMEIELKASFNWNNLLDWKRQQNTSANPRYLIRYISSSERNLSTEIPKAATDTTLTLPAGVIN